MAQKSKFIIQPFKHNVQMDEEYANRTWQTLHEAKATAAFKERRDHRHRRVRMARR